MPARGANGRFIKGGGAGGVKAGDVVWYVGADTAGFDGGMDHASKAATGLSDKFKEQAKVIGLAMTAAGAAITGALGGALHSYVETGSALNDLSLKTGFTVEKLAGLSYAAKQSGTDIGAVEVAAKKMASGIYEAKSSVDDAGKATGPFNDALAAVGLSIDQIAKLKPQDQFTTIAKAVAAVKDPTDRAALAVQFFGRSGTDLLPMLVDNLDAVVAEGTKLSGWTTESAAAADKLGDSWDTLKAALGGVVVAIGPVIGKLVDDVIPAITSTIMAVRDWTNAHPALSEAIVGIVGGLGLLMGALGPIILAMPGIIATIGLFTGGVAAAGAASVVAAPEIAGVGIAMDAVAVSGGIVAGVLGGVVVAAAIAAGVEVWKLVTAWQAAKAEQEKLSETYNTSSLRMIKLAEEYRAAGVEIDMVKFKHMGLDEATQFLNDTLEKNWQTIRNHSIALNENDAASAANAEKQRQLAISADLTNQNLADLGYTIQGYTASAWPAVDATQSFGASSGVASSSIGSMVDQILASSAGLDAAVPAGEAVADSQSSLADTVDTSSDSFDSHAEAVQSVAQGYAQFDQRLFGAATQFTEVATNSGEAADGVGKAGDASLKAVDPTASLASAAGNAGGNLYYEGDAAYYTAEALRYLYSVQAQGGGNGGNNGYARGGIVGYATGGVIPKFAHGGITPAWVGEMGKELMFLPTGTRILSHSDSMKAVSDSGKGGGNIYLGDISIGSIQLDSAQSSGSQAEKILQQIYPALKRKMTDDLDAAKRSRG